MANGTVSTPKGGIVELENRTRSVFRFTVAREIRKDRHTLDRNKTILLGDAADRDRPVTPQTPSPVWRGPQSQIDELPPHVRKALDTLVASGKILRREVAAA